MTQVPVEVGPDPDDAVTLCAKAVSVRFGSLAALTDVTLDIRAGETIGLIGPNGAGKSTLINVLSGLQHPNSGRVLFDGRDISAMPPSSRARLGLGRTFQHVGLFAGMTVRDTLAVAQRPPRFGPRRRAAESAVSSIADSLGISSWLDVQTQLLPLATQRLVAYAMAILPGPRAVLLDEPAAGLPTDDRAVLAKQFASDIHQRDLAVLLVEHDMTFVRELADRVYVLAAGKIIAEGTFDQVAELDVVREAYLGSVSDEHP